MPLRIVHLSDLHWPSTDEAMWAAVKRAVCRLAPQLIIVSGDLVDNPLPKDLRAVQAQLRGLARRTTAPVYVVPGNHDVFELGNATVLGRKDAFDQVFRNDDTIIAPTVAPAGVPADGAGKPGTKGWGFGKIGQAALGIQKDPGRATDVPAVPQPRRRFVREPENLPVPVLLAAFDSNPANDAKLAFAAGEVDPDDLVAVGTELGNLKTPHLVRIAVIHHHVLPIAFSNGTVVGNESLMVLRNSADLLALLAKHRFDLVLHGHKHLSQFVRLDFSPRDADGYPLAVAAAGAAALVQHKNNVTSCGFNCIDVADSGRISIKSFSYGYGTPPVIDESAGQEGIDYRTFEEPMATVTRRAFWRARQRHQTLCDKRICSFVVTENGDLLVENIIEGLRYFGPETPEITRRHWVAFPSHGSLAIAPELDAVSIGNRWRISRGPPQGARQQILVTFRGHLARGKGAGYRLTHAIANAMTMTLWEDMERRRVKPPANGTPAGQEWAGVLVDYPIEMLEILVQLPSGFERMQPGIRCERAIGSPSYEIDSEGDNAEIKPGIEPVPDVDLAEHIHDGLTWLADEGKWRLRVRQPMVGYTYRIFWPLPGLVKDTQIAEGASAWRHRLLQLRAGPPGPGDLAAKKVFDDLTRQLVKLLAGDIQDSCYRAVLFAYDEASLALRPVLTRKSWADTPVPQEFSVHLGDGLAGAAFQQRRIIAWCDGPGQSSSRSRGLPSVKFTTLRARPIADSGETATASSPIRYFLVHPAQVN